MPLTSAITDYDAAWPNLYAREADLLVPVFDADLLALHHVGSTAVEGLAAKPEIDLLAVVEADTALDAWTEALALLKYRRGGDLLAGHRFFKRDVGGVRTHKLHVCTVGHPQIARMLAIRDHLRAHADDRAAYASLKRRLEWKNRTGIAEYLGDKAPFLDELYERIRAERDR